MPVTARYVPEYALVETTLTGAITLTQVHEEIRLTLELIDLHGCERILSDCSAADLQFSISEVYNMPAMQEEAGSSRAYRIAVLRPPTHAGRQLTKFYEDVNVNRGWPAKVFDRREDAIEWLCTE